MRVIPHQKSSAFNKTKLSDNKKKIMKRKIMFSPKDELSDQDWNRINLQNVSCEPAIE